MMQETSERDASIGSKDSKPIHHTNYGPDNDHHNHSQFSISDVEDCYSFDANPNRTRSVKIGPEGHLLLPISEDRGKNVFYCSAAFIIMILVLLSGCIVGYTVGKMITRDAVSDLTKQCSIDALTNTLILQECNGKCEKLNCCDFMGKNSTSCVKDNHSCSDSMEVCSNVKELKIKIEEKLLDSFSKNDAIGVVDIILNQTEANYYHGIESELNLLENKYGEEVILPPPPENLAEICRSESLLNENRLAICKDVCEEAECCHNDITTEGSCYTDETALDCLTYIFGCDDLANFLNDQDP